MVRSTIALAALLLAACSSNTHGVGTTTSGTGTGGGGPSVLYSADPTSSNNPFPDYRLILDGGLKARPSAYVPFVDPAAVAISAGAFQTYTLALLTAGAGLDGFGNFGGELLPFSTSMNPTSLDGAISYVALGATPGPGPAARLAYTDLPPFVEVQPSLPLAPASTYALAVTDSATTATGTPLTRGADFAAWASGPGAAHMGEIATALGIDASHIVFAMVFTTQNARRDVEALASYVTPAFPGFEGDAGVYVPSPAITTCTNAAATTQCPEGVFAVDAGNFGVVYPWFVQSLDIDGGVNQGYQNPPTHVGTVVAGTVTLKDVRDSEYGHFVPASVADPSTARDVDRAFVLVMPNPDVIPMPPGGYPLALVGHALGGRNSLSETPSGNPTMSVCVSAGELFAAAGYACIGIDAPSHGTRGTSIQFFDFNDILVTRDELREMAFDQMQVVQMAAAGVFSGFGPALDTSHIRYLGASLGGIMGATFLSVDPRDVGGVLNVPGGGLTHIFLSPNIYLGLSIILETEVDIGVFAPDGGPNPDFVATLPFFLSTAQMLLESADPINYAAGMPSWKHILIQEGLDDQTVPNNTTDDLAAAFGMPFLDAGVSQDGGVSGKWEYNMANYGLTVPAVDPHRLLLLLPQARAQAQEYILSDDSDILAE